MEYNKNYKPVYADRTGVGRGTFSDIEQFLFSGMEIEEISKHVNLKQKTVRKVISDIIEQKKFQESGIITLPF